MKIVLLRHGQSTITSSERLSAADFGRWIKAYNIAGIAPRSLPSVQAIAQARACAVTVCSNLPRSIESAMVLGVDNIAEQDALYRECEMPHAEWRVPKLSVKTWPYIFRMLQLFGYTFNSESIIEARQRAQGCTRRLCDLAQQNGSVLFVGHGSLNWLIARNLLRLGWAGPSHAGRKHWQFGVYHINSV